MDAIIEINKEFKLCFPIKGNDWIRFEIHHFFYNREGGILQTPVAKLNIIKHPGNDASNPHWEARLTLRSDIYYKNGIAEVRQKLKHKVRKPDQIIDLNVIEILPSLLKEEEIVQEPLAYFVAIERNIEFRAFGDLIRDE